MTQLIARLLKLPCAKDAIARNDAATRQAEAVLRQATRQIARSGSAAGG